VWDAESVLCRARSAYAEHMAHCLVCSRSLIDPDAILSIQEKLDKAAEELKLWFRRPSELFRNGIRIVEHKNSIFRRFLMARLTTKQLAGRIRRTLRKVERTSGVPADNPALKSLKKIFQRRLRELENATDPQHPPVPDWTRGHRTCCS
jgi:hypothetical protein